MPRQGVTGQSWVKYGSDPGVTSPGGVVDYYTAGGTLLVGDAVYISAASTVAKSATGSNHVKRAGIVVGGTQTGMECCDQAADVGATAAASGEQVIVLNDGVCYVPTDAAIAAGVAIAPSTGTAGKVRPALALSSTGVLSLTAGALTLTAGALTLSTPTITSTVTAGATPVTSTGANGSGIVASTSNQVTGTAANPTGTAANPTGTVTMTAAGDANPVILGYMLTATGGAATGLARIALS